MGTPTRLLAAALCLLSAAPAFAGLKITEGDGSTTYLADGRLLSEPSDAAEMVQVFDANSGQITLIDRARKRYAEGSVDDYCGAIRKMQEAAQAQMSPEERKMMQEMLGRTQRKAKPPKVTVKDEGAGGAILGYPTRHYAVYADGKPYEELWITTDKGLLASAGDYRKLMAMTTQLSSCIATGMGGLGSVGGAAVEQSAAYRKLMTQGWALRTRAHSGSLAESSEVKAIDKADIPKSRFAPPAGYDKVSLEAMMRARYSGE